MRPEQMLKEHDFIGRIIEAKDPREEKGDGSADVKIRFIDIDDNAKTAYITLSGEERDMAYDASKDRKDVTITSKLVGVGRNKRIEDPVAFRVLG